MSIKIFFFALIAALCLIQVDSQLLLHGGPVLDFPVSLHFFWYGPWGKNDEEVQILEFFAKNIDSTPWWSVSRCMEDPAGDPITESVDLPTSAIYKKFKKYGQTFTSTLDMETLLKDLMEDHGIDQDPNDIYVLILHDDVKADPLCKDSCGYHYYFNNSARTPIKYILLAAGGLVNTCPECSLNVNGPWGPITNQLVNSFAHFLINTAANPVPWTGWYDANNVEPANKCTRNYPNSAAFLPNKRRQWNVVVNSGSEKHWFLIQGAYDITSNTCRTWPANDCSVIAPPTPAMTAPHDPSSGTMLQAGLSVLVSVLFSFVFLF